MTSSSSQSRRLRGHETTDVKIDGIEKLGIGLIVGAIILFALVGWAIFGLRKVPFFSRATEPLPQVGANSVYLPPQPRLEITETSQLHQYRDAQQKLLNSYQWIDAKQGIARIPIERAMEVYEKQ